VYFLVDGHLALQHLEVQIAVWDTRRFFCKTHFWALDQVQDVARSLGNVLNLMLRSAMVLAYNMLSKILETQLALSYLKLPSFSSATLKLKCETCHFRWVRRPFRSKGSALVLLTLSILVSHALMICPNIELLFFHLKFVQGR